MPDSERTRIIDLP